MTGKKGREKGGTATKGREGAGCARELVAVRCECGATVVRGVEGGRGGRGGTGAEQHGRDGRSAKKGDRAHALALAWGRVAGPGCLRALTCCRAHGRGWSGESVCVARGARFFARGERNGLEV